MAGEFIPVFNDLLAEIPAIQELIKYDQWIVWRLERRGDKWTKPPYQARLDQLSKASTTDERTWGSFSDAFTCYVQAPETWKIGGLGFVFSDKDPFAGADLDSCFSEKGADIEPWALKIVKAVNSYTELSPSSTGLHIICRASLPENIGRRKGKLEVYNHARYFTMTGDHLKGSPDTIEDRQKEYAKIVPKPTDQAKDSGATITTDGVPTLVEMSAVLAPYIDEMATAPESKLDALRANVPEFKKVWERTAIHEDWSDSEWDLSLANYMLAARWAYPEVTEALIEHRRTHGERAKLRADYYARTIIRGLQVSASSEALYRLTSTEIDAIEDPDERRVQILNDVSLSLWNDGSAAIVDFAQNISDPPTYTVKTTDRVVLMQQRDFLRTNEFWVKITGAAGRTAEPMKADKHRSIVDRLLEAKTIANIGDEATDAGQALVWLHDYLDNVKGNIPADGRERKKAMLEGNPILHNGHLRISGDDMVQWLKRARNIYTDMRKLGPMLRAAGCYAKSTPYTNEQGASTSKNLWLIPDDIALDHNIKVRRKKDD